MKTNNKKLLVVLFLSYAAFCLLLAAPFAVCAPQSVPQLQISAPTDGSIVNPGQTVSISVTSPAGISMSSVGVVAEDPLDLMSIASSVPAQFSLTVPSSIPCRKYMLTAAGTTTTGQTVTSAPIFLDVERPDVPRTLSASLMSFSFQSVGDQAKIRFFANFSDGSVFDVTRSTLVSYASSDTTIATVDNSSGAVVVKAVAPGTATITATYGQGASALPISVPVIVPAPLSVSPPQINFPSTPVGVATSPEPATLINSSSSTINVLGVNITGDFSQTNTCNSPLGPEVSCAINVVFQPTAIGARTGSITLTTDGMPSSLTIPLTGTGVRDFSISATPATQTVTPRGTTSYAVSISGFGGFTDSVSLTVTGLPSGATPKFTPTSISGGSGSSTLTITTSSTTPLGTFALTITGTSATATHTATVTLTVKKK